MGLGWHRLLLGFSRVSVPPGLSLRIPSRRDGFQLLALLPDPSWRDNFIAPGWDVGKTLWASMAKAQRTHLVLHRGFGGL